MKVVVNSCYGCFDLSKKAINMLGLDKDDSRSVINRADPKLVEVVQQLGAEANGTYAKLRIVEVDDDAVWEIAEYDGQEWVAEVHRTWY